MQVNHKIFAQRPYISNMYPSRKLYEIEKLTAVNRSTNEPVVPFESPMLFQPLN